MAKCETCQSELIIQDGWFICPICSSMVVAVELQMCVVGLDMRIKANEDRLNKQEEADRKMAGCLKSALGNLDRLCGVIKVLMERVDKLENRHRTSVEGPRYPSTSACM